MYYNTASSPLLADLFPGNKLLRNPSIPRPTSSNYEVAKKRNTPLWPSRLTPGINRGYRELRADGTLKEVTAACGPLIYRGDLFPDEFYGDAFFCEPAANLVKRLVLGPTANGGLEGESIYTGSEFLSSSDERFRPVNLYNGPDGALYLVDMYRGIIQHHLYITTYLRNQIVQRKLDRPIGMGRDRPQLFEPPGGLVWAPVMG
ncbi:MAG: hypothetical protein EXS42_03590 [Lacunisphaera sp.]|nr:hypothetical protein [Lacunisphaera sp.]